MTTIVDTGIRPLELDVIRLVRALGAAGPGAEGTIVAAHPEVDSYTLELVDSSGGVLAVIEAGRADFTVIWRP